MKKSSSAIPSLARLQRALSAVGARYARRPRWVGAGLRLLGAFYLALGLLALWLPIDLAPSYATEVRAADGTLYHAFLSDDDTWRFVTPPHEVPPVLLRALLLKEDRWFYRHPGVNPAAVLRAAAGNLFSGRRASGASTVTMQVVRLARPRARTYLNKTWEMLLALALELRYSKDDILAYYLARLPYGSNIEGVRAAALVYYGKPLQALSPAELTTLAIIPNRPTSLRPGRDAELLRTARNRWLRRYGALGVWDAATLASALDEPLELSRRQLPQLAPHLALRLRSEHAGSYRIASRLNLELQTRAETLLADYIRRIRHLGIANAAALVVNNRTHAVEAYVGSADFAALADGGQVDGVRAVRSPGSTLKPLLYGLAFDAGLVTPHTRLLDVPLNLSGYAPENYDGTYRGAVTASFALGNSLNVPAVALLNELGTETLLDRLESVGFEQIRADRQKLGLSVVLGGCGVRLDELVGLFAALAEGGTWQPLRYTAANHPRRSVRLLSPEAAEAITQTLRQITRPDLPNNATNVRDLPPIAWKTGTSYGRRDAWAIGYTDTYTIGVWCGNFSGAGSPLLAGADIATPLLFRLFNALDRSAASQAHLAPRPLLPTRWVCAETGLPPDTFCHSRVEDAYRPGVSPHVRCQHLQWGWVSADGTTSYCSECLPTTPTQRILLPNYPPALLAWHLDQGHRVALPPPHNPACQHQTAQRQGLRITSPTAGAEYFVERGQRQRLALRAECPPDGERIHWFVGGRFVGERPPSEAFFLEPDTGRVVITATDARGRTDNLKVYVRRY